MNNNTIYKNLAPEERTAIANMVADLQKILSLTGEESGEMTPAEPVGSVEEALKKLAGAGEGENSEEEQAMKANEGPTANDNADTRLEPTTEINDDNISEVGKALLLALSAKNPTIAQKALISVVTGNQTPQVSAPVNHNVGYVQKGMTNYGGGLDVQTLVTVVKKSLEPVVHQINQQSLFQQNITEALGLTDKMFENSPVNKSQENRQVPVGSTDASAIVNELVSVLKSNIAGQNNVQQGQYHQPAGSNYQVVGDSRGLNDARKSLKQALPHLFRNALGQAGKGGAR